MQGFAMHPSVGHISYVVDKFENFDFGIVTKTGPKLNDIIYACGFGGLCLDTMMLYQYYSPN